MKRIFFLNSCLEWGGGEKWTLDTAYALNRLGYDVIIGSKPQSVLFKRAQEMGLQVKKTPVKNSLSALDPYQLISFCNYLKKQTIDVIFLNLSHDLKFGGLASKLAGINKVIYVRSIATPIKDRWYYRFLFKNCITDIIANSQATKETILQNTAHWLKEEKIKVIYNGIKTDFVNKDRKHLGNNIRKEYNIAENMIVMVNIGRLTYEKGHSYLLDAVSIMRKELENFKVLIVGQGELENKIRSQIKELALEKYIILTGFRNDIFDILYHSDFLIHTALWEGFGYVIAEAMAMGKPVVSTNVSSIGELVLDKETGYLAESKNPDDIAHKALMMIEQLKNKKYGKKGQQTIEENFSLDKMITELEKYFLQ